MTELMKLVMENTGMPEQLLRNDRTSYKLNKVREFHELVKKCKSEGRKFTIVGDYDVDGVSASTIMQILLRIKYDIEADVRLPKRFSEGYGLSEKIIGELTPGQAVVTVDNGIAAIPAIKAAKEKGMTVIVTDHHMPVTDADGNIILPKANLIIDPKAIRSDADYDGYCGAGIAYKLAETIFGYRDGSVRKMRVLAAIATIADSMPLTFDNRRIVKNGLTEMVRPGGPTAGLYALLSELGIEDYVDTDAISYYVAPALNSPGRLYDDGAMKSYRLLAFDGDSREAQKMAQEIIADNTARKDISKEWMNKIQMYLDAHPEETEKAPVVIRADDIHPGIVGIIAGKVAESCKMPCILFGKGENGMLHGSGRSFGGIDLKALLDKTQDHIVQYGGHREAAGVTILETEFDALKKALKDVCPEGAAEESEEEPVIDVPEAEIKDMLRDIDMLSPFGRSNPMPEFRFQMTLVEKGSSYYRILKNDGVKLFSQYLDAIAFHDGETYLSLGTPRHVVVTGKVHKNCFHGRLSDQVLVTTIESDDSLR